MGSVNRKSHDFRLSQALANQVARKGVCGSFILCGLSPPVSPRREMVSQYTFWVGVQNNGPEPRATPAGADRILWEIRPDGTLLRLEGIVDSATHPVGLMELLLLVIGGRERSEAEFRSLLHSAGFSLTRIIPTQASSVIECHPI